MAWFVQNFSGLPQLIETTDGLRTVSWMAALRALRTPAAVWATKKTAIFALRTSPPATSISSMTSPSGPLGLPVGELCAPDTETAVTLGLGIPSEAKYFFKSVVR